jgi:hypothetical protein
MLLLPSWASYQHEGVLLGVTCIFLYLVSYFLLDLKSSKKLSRKALRSIHLREAFNRIEKNVEPISTSDPKSVPLMRILTYQLQY